MGRWISALIMRSRSKGCFIFLFHQSKYTSFGLHGFCLLVPKWLLAVYPYAFIQSRKKEIKAKAFSEGGFVVVIV